MSPFTISVGGDTFDVPTYAIFAEGNEDLLAMEDGSTIENSDGFIQRWHYRWFVCKDGEWFSLRLIR
jgi:hypothetical protein